MVFLTEALLSPHYEDFRIHMKMNDGEAAESTRKICPMYNDSIFIRQNSRGDPPSPPPQPPPTPTGWNWECANEKNDNEVVRWRTNFFS